MTKLHQFFINHNQIDKKKIEKPTWDFEKKQKPKKQLNLNM